MLHDLSSEVTDSILRQQFFGRLGCCVDGQVLIVPMAYLYDGQAIYGQTREGTKTRALRQNPAVCFEVDEVSDPTCWRSVVVQGVYEELQGDERTYIQQRMGPGRIAPHKDAPIAVSEPQPEQPMIVYRIRITSKTGRSEIKEH